ncbi:pyridine nucleotide-disulphide oxidoreductase domain-containing protein, putative [Eimeria brunetti]|uniref:Pyridine nucleotide-disulphide oxidoreductase domain-containing protein, putative n=1 Tax=Eimeria brunetti TaxID=51314 RepID=U6LM24_9EIME|nr:pyridine nucleotide-disulphide oxidoreductase domain-containing protein, putative [Eimeria brunetti]
MRVLGFILERRTGSPSLLQQAGNFLRQLQRPQQQQQQQLQQQQQQQQQPFFGHAATGRAGMWGGCHSVQQKRQLQQQQQQQQQQQRQQQQQQQRRAGSAAMASAAAAFCFAASNQRRQVKLGDVSDFPEGGVYEVAVNGGKDKVLVSHVGGAFYCTGSSCPHYGAPLVKGPVTEGIPTYPIEVKGQEVVASLPERMQDEGPRQPCCCSRPDTAFEDKTFVIVGGGPAGLAAAEELRALGFKGKKNKRH